MNNLELPCTDNRKSFYGKATVIYTPDNCKYLRSYNTIVCYVDAFGIFHRTWDGYSATTMRHINSFLDYCHIYPAAVKHGGTITRQKIIH